MRWKSLLTCCRASMCSTAQSPRAAKVFSRASAARTCPAPDVAASSDFLQNSSRNFLQIPEAREVVLKIVVQELRVLRAELRPQNHVTQFYRVRKQRLLLQFLERNLGVIVIHGFPQAEKSLKRIV